MLWTFLVVPQAWTIGLEIAFYLIAPFIVRKKISLIMFLIAASLALRIVLNYSGLNDDPWSYRFFPTELVFFLLGTLAYHFQKHLSKINIPPVYYKIILSLTLAFTLFYSLLPISAVIKPWLYILFVFGSLPFVFISTKTQKFDRYIGELSYPMYLSHTFLLACVMSLKIKPIGSMGITVTILTVLLSIALNELIAKRIEKLRQRRVTAIA
jgi:peptidoglycan/LPS O-acetylase OafA/YrhL